MKNRKIIEAYYNVDTQNWCTADGSYAPPLLIPRFALYEHCLLKLTLVHNFGVVVTDFNECSAFAFVAYDEGGSPVVRTITTGINTQEVNMLWPDADTYQGRFGILVDCDMVELQSALGVFDNKKLRVDIVISDVEDNVLAIYTEKVSFNNSPLKEATLNDIVLLGKLTSGTIPVSINDTYADIVVSTTTYGLVSFHVEAPIGATVAYTVTNVSILPNSFRVFFNATIGEAGHVLAYSLIRKS
jgi:hypothetical protein